MKNLSELINIEATEEKLLELTTECIVAYSQKNLEVEFHSLVFDTNISYGEVLLSAESYAGFARRMESWQSNSGFNPLLDRWASGDFDHSLFSESYEKFNQEWEQPYAKAIKSSLSQEFQQYWDKEKKTMADEQGWEKLKNECRSMFARVCQQLYHADEISHIRKSPDFWIMCIDHNEHELDAMTRQIIIAREFR